MARAASPTLPYVRRARRQGLDKALSSRRKVSKGERNLSCMRPQQKEKLCDQVIILQWWQKRLTMKIEGGRKLGRGFRKISPDFTMMSTSIDRNLYKIKDLRGSTWAVNSCEFQFRTAPRPVGRSRFRPTTDVSRQRNELKLDFARHRSQFENRQLLQILALFGNGEERSISTRQWASFFIFRTNSSSNGTLRLDSGSTELQIDYSKNRWKTARGKYLGLLFRC